MGRIDTTEAAEDDLAEAALFIAEDDIIAAERFVENVEERYRLLADSPELGRPREDLGPDIRCLPFRKYLIFYRPIEGGIQVVRFLSGYREIESLFG